MTTNRWEDIRKKSKLTEAQRNEVDRRVEHELLDMSLREMRELA